MSGEERQAHLNAIAAGMNRIKAYLDYGPNPIDGDVVDAVWDWNDEQLAEQDKRITDFMRLVDNHLE